ncbi:UNVERIFIED_CONTAM: hypothetical protein RMT77_010743 [Armadillidium vulgare]
MSIIQLGKMKCNNSNQQNLFVLCSRKRKNMSEDVHDINGSDKKMNMVEDKTLSVGYQHQKLAKTFALRNKNGKKFQGDRTFREPKYTTVNITNKNLLKKEKKSKNVNKSINCAKEKLGDKMNASDVPMNFIIKKKRKLNKNLNHQSTSINKDNSIKRTKSDNAMNDSEVPMNSPLQKRKNLNKYLNDQHHSHKKQKNSINKINSDSVVNTSEVPMNSGLKKKKKVNKNFNDQNSSYNETHLSVFSSTPKKKKKIFSETNQVGKFQQSSLFKTLQLSTVRNRGRTSEYSRENEHEKYINKNAENLTPSSIGKIWKSENCNEFHEEKAKFSKFDLKKSFVKGKNTIHLNSNTSEGNKFKVRKCEGIGEKDTIKKKGNQFNTSKHIESRVDSNQKRRENHQVLDEHGSNLKLQSDIGIRKQNLISKLKNNLSLESQPEKLDEELATKHISKVNKLSSSNSSESLKSLNKIYKRKKHDDIEEKNGSDINYSETFGSKTNKINCVNIKSSEKRNKCFTKQSNNDQDGIKSFTTTRSLGYQRCNSDSASEIKLERDTLNSEGPNKDSFLVRKMLFDLSNDQSSNNDSVVELLQKEDTLSLEDSKSCSSIDRKRTTPNSYQHKFEIDNSVSCVEETSTSDIVSNSEAVNDHKISVEIVEKEDNLRDLTNSKLFCKDNENLTKLPKNPFKSCKNPSFHLPSQKFKLFYRTQKENIKTETADKQIATETEHLKSDNLSSQNETCKGNKQNCSTAFERKFYILNNSEENKTYALLPESLFSDDNYSKILEAQFFDITPQETMTEVKYLFAKLEPSVTDIKQCFHNTNPISTSIEKQMKNERETSSMNVHTSTTPNLKEVCIKEKINSPNLSANAAVEKPIVFNFKKNGYSIIKNFERIIGEDCSHNYKQTKIEDYLKPKKRK